MRFTIETKVKEATSAVETFWIMRYRPTTNSTMEISVMMVAQIRESFEVASFWPAHFASSASAVAFSLASSASFGAISP